MTRTRGDHDERREQCGGRVQHRTKEQAVETEAHERAEERDAQRQKDAAERSETVPERPGDDDDEEQQGAADVEEAVAVHPSDQDRGPGGA